MQTRRLWLIAAAPALLATLAGCGTVLHPERRGQPAGRIDWGVFALDAIGLIFFFIPGVIAFAVDFTTGAIYLPPEVVYPTVPLTQKLRRLKTAAPSPTVAEVEALVSSEIGTPLRIAPGTCWTERMDHLDDFATLHNKLAQRQRVNG